MAHSDDWMRGMIASKLAIDTHPGSVAANRWQSLRRSHSVFVSNANDMRLFLMSVEQDPAVGLRLFPTSGVAHVADADELTRSLDQKLHNLLSAAASLVEHTAKRLKAYEGHQFMAGWAQRNKDVALSPVAEFLHDFRNIVLHVRNPPYRQSLSITFVGSPAYQWRVYLPTVALLAMSNSGWTSAAKRYIRESGDGIHLRAATDEYIEMMEALYRWAFDQFDTLHGEEIAELNALVTAHNAKWDAGPGPATN